MVSFFTNLTASVGDTRVVSTCIIFNQELVSLLFYENVSGLRTKEVEFCDAVWYTDNNGICLTETWCDERVR